MFDGSGYRESLAEVQRSEKKDRKSGTEERKLMAEGRMEGERTEKRRFGHDESALNGRTVNNQLIGRWEGLCHRQTERQHRLHAHQLTN